MYLINRRDQNEKQNLLQGRKHKKILRTKVIKLVGTKNLFKPYKNIYFTLVITEIKLLFYITIFL